ncbi:hypothetical protein [Mesorhizobium sanjuanii]|nr:hypothetical protein [Mesorhizobium sanjuanii]
MQHEASPPRTIIKPRQRGCNAARREKIPDSGKKIVIDEDAHQPG